MKRIVFVFALFAFLISINAHPWKPKHYVIIDTDGGFDDMRAITLMLASPEIRVLAITASPGVLSAEDTYAKVKSLLKTFHHEGVLTGINDTKEIEPMNCKPAKEFGWGNKDTSKYLNKSATEVVSYVVTHTSEPITFVCLGNLNLVNQCKETLPGIYQKVKSVVWSVGLDNITQSFNYKLDIDSYNSIINSTFNLNIVDGNSGNKNLDDYFNTDSKCNYNRVFYESLSVTSSPYSKACFDEKTVLYLHYPDFFASKKEGNITKISQRAESSSAILNQLYNNILDGNTLVRSQVLKQIPVDTTFYLPDVQQIAEKTILKYGKEEWKTAVIANEMHRHLGVVATIGAKMGIRAREYFAAGLDEMFVISHAGFNQPLSCMNDGLQASTGATLGHGLITVDTTVATATAEAIFVYMDRKLKVTLKPDVQKQIFAELREYNYMYGLQSDIYWELVRKTALKYWSSLDRHEIFIIEEIN